MDHEPAAKEEAVEMIHHEVVREHSPDQLERIVAWRNDVPQTEELEDATIGQALTIQLYKDWLEWAAHDALAWLRKLDKFERRFRSAGFAYHQVPYQLRHSSAMLHGCKIEQPVLSRLSQILETDRPRSKQTFFGPWCEISKTAAEVLSYSHKNTPLANELTHLRTVHRNFELSLWKLFKLEGTLETGLRWLEQTVAEVTERSDLDGTEALAAKYSREGGLLRRWLQTFPESESCPSKSKHHFIEWYVERLLDVGVEEDDYWSALVATPLSKGGTGTSCSEE
jgi:hypothetical protein